jgi:hypothetical protein
MATRIELLALCQYLFVECVLVASLEPQDAKTAVKLSVTIVILSTSHSMLIITLQTLQTFQTFSPYYTHHPVLALGVSTMGMTTIALCPYSVTSTEKKPSFSA